nr:hypothetical protein [uncultured Treponema sp.]
MFKVWFVIDKWLSLEKVQCTIEEASKLWELSTRSVRNYCAQGRVPGALLEGKTWKIPSNAEKPGRKTRHIETENNLLAFLKLKLLVLPMMQ